MPLKLINPINSLERALAQQGLDTIDCGEADLCVYGGGLWTPGEAYDKLLAAKRNGSYLGVVGMTVPEDILASDIAEDRMNLGHVLLRASKANAQGEWATYPAFVADSISQGYMGHFACNAEVGGHPAWLAREIDSACFDADLLNIPAEWLQSDAVAPVPALDDVSCCYTDGEPDDGVGLFAYGELGPAIAAALLGLPCILYIPVEDGGVHADRAARHPLMRFANEFNVRNCVALTKTELEDRLQRIEEMPVVPQHLVDEAKAKARETLLKMLPPVAKRNSPTALMDVAGAIATALGATVEEEEDMQGHMGKRILPSSAPSANSGYGPVEIPVGTPFDPTTHYGPDYYAEGRGYLFTNTDGTKQIYHGPGQRWGAFKQVAGIISHTLPKKGRYLSLGCGAGDDVLRFLEEGWDAYGIDLSESAVAAGIAMDARLDGRLICQDVLTYDDLGGGTGSAGFDLICTFDFWEHIWLKDVDALQKRVLDLLKPGGVHFNIVCTRSKLEQDWTIKPGDCFTQENSWLLVSGHVTMRTWHWWMQRFKRNGFVPRTDVGYVFQLERQDDAGLKEAQSWDLRHTVVIGKQNR